jgi:hypothetical protein
LLHSENPTTLRKIDVHRGWVAQSAEQWTENPRVGGSIPPPAKAPISRWSHGAELLAVRDLGVEEFSLECDDDIHSGGEHVVIRQIVYWSRVVKRAIVMNLQSNNKTF